MSSKRLQSGFSALEVMVVVLVVGILAAIAVPNIVSASRSYTLLTAAQALEQQLNRCRQEAVRANQPVQIQITAHSSVIDTDHDGVFTDEGFAATISNDASVTMNSPTDTNGKITFTSRGEMLIGVNPSLTVSYSGHTRTVTIDPRGAVQVGPEV